LMVVSKVPEASRPSGSTAFVGESFAIGAGLGEENPVTTRCRPRRLLWDRRLLPLGEFHLQGPFTLLQFRQAALL
jgi:hypothetical protein